MLTWLHTKNPLGSPSVPCAAVKLVLPSMEPNPEPVPLSISQMQVLEHVANCPQGYSNPHIGLRWNILGNNSCYTG